MVAMEQPNPPLMSEAEYLAFADEQEFKYEYRYGEVVAMVGGSLRHGIITANVIIHTGNQLRDTDCMVTSPDVRVYIAHRRTYRYPDVTVFCGDPGYLEGRTDTLISASVLFEVLSPGTALTDRNEKLEEYTRIESLQAYVLVSQHEPKVEVFRRHTAGQWLYEYVNGLDAEIMIPVANIEVMLSLAEIYRRVQWEKPDEQGDKALSDNL